MTELNKETKSQIGIAVQNLYKNTRLFNTLAGNTNLCSSRLPNQLELVRAEIRELEEDILSDNLGGIAKEVLDVLVTLSEVVMCIDGNDSLCANPPKYLNQDDMYINQLFVRAKECFLENNYIDSLGYFEDIVYQLNADMIANINSTCESNLSKFITLKGLDESAETEFSLCDYIIEQGRYTDVYTEITEYQGTEWVAIKAKQDVKHGEYYPKGKLLKNPVTYKEASIIIYG